MTREPKVVRERRAEISALRRLLRITDPTAPVNGALIADWKARLAWLEKCESPPSYRLTSGATRSGSR